MATGSRYSCYYVKEQKSNITPASAKFIPFRVTKSGLDINIKTLESEELRDDAETADFRLGARHVEGAVTGEMSFGTFDELIAAALRSSWQDNVVKGGIERHSFTFVDFNADIPEGKYTIYRGCEVNSMAFSLSAENMTTVEFGIVGRSMEIADTLPVGSTVLERTTTSPMDGFQGRLLEGGQEISVITEIGLTVENGIEPRFVVGSKFSIDPSSGRRAVNGTANVYFIDNTLRNKYLDETETSITFDLIDPANPNQKYTVEIPRVKFTEAPRPIDGEGDIMLNMGYKGLLDPTVGSSIKITRVVEASGAAALAKLNQLEGTK
ncbi:tail tube protein [Hafnia phage yong3]|nr:tail tube protein [Hafnia phage yong3]